MKKIFTLLASLILSVAVFAAAKPKSTLTIQNFDRSAVRVVIDGRRFEPNDNVFRIQNIEAGNHQVKIYRQKKNGMFTILGNRFEVVFNSMVSIRPRSNVMISIDRLGRATVSDSRRNDRGGYDGRDWSRNDDDFDFDRTRQNGDYDGGQWGDYDNHYGYNGMNQQEFNRVLESIDKEWLETNKLKSALHVATTSNLTSAQVKQLMLLFSFESNKLDVAKQAYTNTIDKRNYSIVNDAFSFNSSKDELARFIRNFR